VIGPLLMLILVAPWPRTIQQPVFWDEVRERKRRDPRRPFVVMAEAVQSAVTAITPKARG
jgi:hypothetical protein